MKKIFFLFALLATFITYAQEPDKVKGIVLNAANDEVMENVHVLNLNKVIGTTTNAAGEFQIAASVNDTLYFSFLGFESLEARVTKDWLQYGNVKVKMTEVGIALEQVVVRPIRLTGYLEIDAKNIPVYENVRYTISGLGSGYEGGEYQPGAVSKVLGAIFNPADLMHQIFGNKPQQMRKLRKMKENDEIRALLQKKYDRHTLVALLQINEFDIERILMNCNFSKEFIETANDLQILDALSGCYEEYKVLERSAD